MSDIRSYESMWKAIVWPDRAQYDIEALGPKEFKVKSKPCKREDFELWNKWGQKLACSLYEPSEEIWPKKLPCVICLHGN